MPQRSSKPEAATSNAAGPVMSRAAAYGTPLADFSVPGPHGLVVFHAGRRTLVEPQVRRLLGPDAPIRWET